MICNEKAVWEAYQNPGRGERRNVFMKKMSKGEQALYRPNLRGKSSRGKEDGGRR